MTELFLCVFLALGLVAPAQSPTASVEGAWNVSVTAAKDSAASGRTRSRNAISAKMQLTVKGEAVTGTWTTSLGEVWSLHGTWKAGRLDLMTDPRDVSGTADGKKVSIKTHWEIRGAFKNDTLGGTCTMIFGKDADDPLWSSWTASRPQ